MPIDYLASWPHYGAHIAPVWAALPDVVKGSGDAVLVAGYSDLSLARRRGYRQIALIEHGIGQSYGNGNPGFPGGKHRDAVGLFLSPNETAASRDQAAYPKARVEVVGSPRIDTLPQRVPDGQTTAAISFHWGSDIAPETRSTLPYYRPVLPELACAFHIIGHAHPRIADEAARVYAQLGIEFVPDFDDVCRLADVLVMDNSSCIYEFASTGRPVVVLNGPAMRRDVQLGLRFWTAADVGIQVDCPTHLIAAVRLALTDPPAQQIAREAALAITYGLRHGSAAAAATVICDWLAADQAVAA